MFRGTLEIIMELCGAKDTSQMRPEALPWIDDNIQPRGPLRAMPAYPTSRDVWDKVQRESPHGFHSGALQKREFEHAFCRRAGFIDPDARTDWTEANGNRYLCR